MRRATIWLLVGLVSFAILTGSFMISVVAWRIDRNHTTTAEALTAPTALAPGSRVQSELRPLPLYSDRTDPAVPITPDTLTEELADLGSRLGLPHWLPAEAQLTIEQYVQAEAPIYPYSYPNLDEIVGDHLIDAATDLLLDYTATAVTAAANAEEYQGFDHLQGGAVLAYSVLRRALDLHPRCDLQLQLLYVVTLGQNARDESITSEMEKAQELCPDDPLPLWLRSQDRAQRAFQPMVESDLTAQQLLVGALADLDTLQREHPDSPLGFAGKADLLLDRADAVEQRGVRPFQARQWRRDAADLYAQARALSNDPGLLAGQARALSALGSDDAASAAIALMPLESSPMSAVVTQRVRLAQASGHPETVLELLSGDVTFPNGREVSKATSRLAGYGRLQALTTQVWDATHKVQGGAGTADVAFIPQSRRIYLTDGVCLEQAGRDARLMMGAPMAEAAAWRPPSFETPPRYDGSSRCDRGLPQPDTSQDTAQDLLRWGGDLTGAQQLVKDWIDAKPDSYLAHQRAGEISYLAGAWDAAAAEFSEAARHWQDSDTDKDEYFWELDAAYPNTVVALQLAAAQEAGGDVAAASRTLTGLLHRLGQPDPASDTGDPPQDALTGRFYAHSQLGAAALGAGRDRDAVEHLSKALKTAAEFEGPDAADLVDAEGDSTEVVLLRGAQESNLALALARTRRPDDAIRMAHAALSRDSANPILLDTLAFAYDLAGNPAAAVPAYEAALAADPTSYVSANNLAVLVGKAGDVARSRFLLEQVVAVSPSYSVGWHNLGVAEARSGVGHALDSQHAMGVAARLDRSLRGEGADYIVDDTIYPSGLDISKPLPPTWTYASSASQPADGFLLSMIILVVARLAWSLGLDRVSEAVMARMARRTTGRGLPARLLALTAPAAVAVAASIVVLSIGPVLWAPTLGESAIVATIVAAATMLPLSVRHLLADDARIVAEHQGSGPAVAVGLLGIVIGITLAPYPGLASTGQRQPGRVVWAAAATAAGVGVAFAALAAASAVPLARLVAMATIALAASIMLPVRPFDGARLTSRAAGLAIGAVTIVAAAATSLQWL